MTEYQINEERLEEGSMKDLPEELWIKILSDFSFGEIINAMCTCKSWYRVIKNIQHLFEPLIDKEFVIKYKRANTPNDYNEITDNSGDEVQYKLYTKQLIKKFKPNHMKVNLNLDECDENEKKAFYELIKIYEPTVGRIMLFKYKNIDYDSFTYFRNLTSMVFVFDKSLFKEIESNSKGIKLYCLPYFHFSPILQWLNKEIPVMFVTLKDLNQFSFSFISSFWISLKTVDQYLKSLPDFYITCVRRLDDQKSWTSEILRRTCQLMYSELNSINYFAYYNYEDELRLEQTVQNEIVLKDPNYAKNLNEFYVKNDVIICAQPDRSEINVIPREIKLNERLPEGTMIEIFLNLSNGAMWNSICAYESWSQIFTSSSVLLNKLKLVIDQKFIKNWRKFKLEARVEENCQTKDFLSIKSWLSNVPIRDLIINYNYYNYVLEEDIFYDILNTFKDSIEIIELNERIVSIDVICKLLQMFPKLNHLDLALPYTNIEYNSDLEALNLPNLKTLNFNVKHCDDIRYICNAFVDNQAIETVTANFTNINYDSAYGFSSFIQTMPNVRSLSISEGYPNEGILFFKLEKFVSNRGYENATKLLNFLKSQHESLKHLELKNLPIETGGIELVDFIFDQMNLEEFHIGRHKIIHKNKLQKFERTLWFFTKQIPFGFALSNKVKNLRKLEIQIKDNDANDNDTLILNQPTEAFKNLNSLTFIYKEVSSYDPTKNYFQKLLNFFKNVRNIKKFKIALIVQDFNNYAESLKSCLLTFTELEELNIFIAKNIFDIQYDEEVNDFVENYRINNDFIESYCKIIRDSCLCLKILKVQKYRVERVKTFFGELLKVEVGKKRFRNKQFTYFENGQIIDRGGDENDNESSDED